MSRVKNEIGNVYGKLTVIEQSPSKNGKAMWLCKCECGELTIKPGRDLRNGKIVGCGKCKNYKNEIGNRYGRLVVESKIGTSKNGVIWLCKCDCGNYTQATGHLLRSGDKKSCGCLVKVIEKPGTRYGKLVVIGEGGRDNQGCVKWVCQCDCGNMIEVSGHSLRQGNTKSCGCVRSWGETLIQNILKDKEINYITQYIIDECRDIKPLPFDICIPIDSHQILIEFDGIQHFEYIDFFKTSYEHWSKQREHDLMKDQYCQEHSNLYHLYRIKYNDDVEQRLIEILTNENLIDN